MKDRIGGSDSASSQVKHLSIVMWVLITGAAIGLLLALAAPFAKPALYIATAIIQVPRVEGASAGQDSELENVEAALGKLKSDEVFTPVIQELDLPHAYSAEGKSLSPEECRLRLTESVNLGQLKNTALVQIGVRDTDPDRAAVIANSVALNSIRLKQRETESRADRSLVEFKNELEKQRALTNFLGNQLASMRTAGIVDPAPEEEGVPERPVTLNSVSKEQLESYLEAKTKYVQAKKILGAAEKRFASARLERVAEIEPVKMMERAEPPVRPRRGWVESVLGQVLGR